MEFSKMVLAGLVQNKPFAKKVFPHLKPEFFPDYEQTYLFKLVKQYVIQYKGFPTLSTIKIELTNKKDVNENLFKSISELIEEIFTNKLDCELEWLVKNTESWCKERAIYNALIKSIEYHEEKKNLESIPELLRKALQVGFESSCGIEFFDEKSIEERLKLYKQKIKKFPTGLEKLDIVTGGGFESKSLCLVFGMTGSGKTTSLVAFSANMVRNGEDVLYITLEMSEEKISQRHEANFIGTPINEIKEIKNNDFKDSLLKIKQQQVGRLIIKEYPPATISSENIRALLDELELKKNFKPTVLVVDYLNLMRSSRLVGDNLYVTIKAISEELRGIAVDKDLCCITATQANRQGNDSKATDLDFTNVGECLSLNSTIVRDSGEVDFIKNLKIGDKIFGHNKIVEVKNIFDVKTKSLYKIKTKLGKEIICSHDHSFPTIDGYKKIAGTLKVGTKIKTYESVK